MYKITLIGAAAPDNLTIGTLNMSKGESRDVAYLTSDILEARVKDFITISPEPPVLDMQAVVLTNNSGGTNNGFVVPPVTDVASAASAVSVLADNQNRIAVDLGNIAVMLVNLQTQSYAMQSILNRYVKE